MEAGYLSTLNPPQLEAVNHDPSVPLQILAGPGSGKTKVLTTRIAHLILDHKIAASTICAVTFTNKAATEMRERLNKLLGKNTTSQLRMGTFHALCALFLRKYAQNVGVENNFTVCDTDESKAIVAPLLKKYKSYLEAKDIVLKEGTVLALISKAKAKGQTAQDYQAEVQSQIGSSQSIAHEIPRIAAEIYGQYEATLRKNNSLDFDDLLLYGVRLFKHHKPAVNWCRHILVDEFQDTNTTQYELMKALAVARCVTIVGDPDQSIYGWRSAEVENLSKMSKDFPNTKQIFLEQNYRSTGTILKASLAIVSQDKSRIPKFLHTAHPDGKPPILMSLDSEHGEAEFIASEIKRLVAYTGGMLKWGDFVILLRFNALSRAIESALQKERIPNRILGGHKFFERMEIKDLLAYLQLVDNPQFGPAFVRAVNVPSRGIGEKTLAEINTRAQKAGMAQLALVDNICAGKVPDTKPSCKRKLATFVSILATLRQLASGQAAPSDLIRKLLDLIGYEEHLRKSEQDWEVRWENVQELITFASDVETENKNQASHTFSADDTPLRLFLQASMLSSEGDNAQNEKDNRNKVTIATCHSAKGLEWPVVMVPAVEQGTFPFYRSEDTEEERRLLYVACTRAQSLLYLSHAIERKVGGAVKKKELSPFIVAALKEDSTLFADDISEFSSPDTAEIAQVLGRTLPEERLIRQQVSEFKAKQATAQPLRRVKLQNVRTPFRHVEVNDPPPVVAQFSRPSTLKEPTVSGPPPPPIFAMSSPMEAMLSPGSGPQRSTSYSSSGPCLPTSYSSGLCLPTSSLPTNQQHSSFGPSTFAVRMSQPDAGRPQVQVHPSVATEAAGTKRRLGMGRGGAGYSNKKFKPQTPA